jgi:hypothetical protein
MIRLVLLSTDEAAAILGRSVYGMKQDRYRMRGLPYIKFDGGQIKYLLSDVKAALAAKNNRGGNNGKEEGQKGKKPTIGGQTNTPTPAPG